MTEYTITARRITPRTDFNSWKRNIFVHIFVVIYKYDGFYFVKKITSPRERF